MWYTCIDIETECAKWDCEDSQCKHALFPHTSRITVIGLWDKHGGRVFRGDHKLKDLGEYLASKEDIELIFHNGKFDLRHLHYSGLNLTKLPWNDTQVMASISTKKVSEEWLTWYESRRVEENKKLPKGVSHRKARGMSLKTLAPFFLGVEPFWETPDNHDNDTYVLKDCQYTYDLYHLFADILKEEDSFGFYCKKVMKWVDTLLKAELRGILLDIPLLKEKWKEAAKQSSLIKYALDDLWDSAYTTREYELKRDLELEYHAMAEKAIAKSKDKSDKKIGKITERYKNLFYKAAEKIERKLNFDSPAQMKWLLKDYLKLPIENYDGEESTGRGVLESLSHREDIKLFLDYRKNRKLATSFFPTYMELKNDSNELHCTFNPDGTRTGRLSSNDPNLQQVPGHLHSLFVARPGYSLVTNDESAIEARIILYYTEDPILFGIFRDDIDFHSFNTKLFFPELGDLSLAEIKTNYPKHRQVAKNCIFGIFYGAGVDRIVAEGQRHGFLFSRALAQQIRSNIREQYRNVFEFKEKLDQDLENGETVRNYFGRPVIPDKDNIYMTGFNTLIQGTASDLVLDSAASIQEVFKDQGVDGHVLLLIHDELVIEVNNKQLGIAKEIIDREMTKYPLQTALGNVSLKVEGRTGPCWQK